MVKRVRESCFEEANGHFHKTCPRRASPGFKFRSDFRSCPQSLHGVPQITPQPPPSTPTGLPTTLVTVTILTVQNFHTQDCCLASSNAVHISAAPYSPNISDGYVTDRSPRFVLTPDMCPVSIHRKGEAGPPPLAVTEARTCQPSEGKPSFTAFPRLPLDSTPIIV